MVSKINHSEIVEELIDELLKEYKIKINNLEELSKINNKKILIKNKNKNNRIEELYIDINDETIIFTDTYDEDNTLYFKIKYTELGLQLDEYKINCNGGVIDCYENIKIRNVSEHTKIENIFKKEKDFINQIILN